jgi:hypothetical protein
MFMTLTGSSAATAQAEQMGAVIVVLPAARKFMDSVTSPPVVLPAGISEAHTVQRVGDFVRRLIANPACAYRRRGVRGGKSLCGFSV